MSKTETSGVRYSGPGFTALLQLMFIGFKLGGVIDWSWVWVLAPAWISVLLYTLVVAALIISAALFS